MRRTLPLVAVAVCAVVAPLAACANLPAPGSEGEGEGAASEGEGEGATAGEGEGEGEGEGAPVDVTWYRDLLPIARQKCEMCHTAGGIGPFDIEDEGAIVGEENQIAAFVNARIMPPWMPAKDCGGHTYAGDRSLSDDQIALFAAWSAGGFALGDPADASGTVPTLGTLDRVDATLTPGQGYVPVQLANHSDDYHCFLLDPGFSSTKFVTGVDIHPGTRSMVHHVLLYAVDRAAAQQKEADAEAAGGFGWTCFGGPDVGGGGAPAVLAAWAPGSDATLYPAGTGIQLDASKVVVMQIHYNFAAAPAPIPADITSAELQLEDSIPFTQQATLIPVVDDTFQIPPTTSGYTDSNTFPASAQGFGVKVWGLLPHMHQLGRHINVTLNAGSPGAECLVDIPQWDFSYQQSYFFTDVPFVQTHNGDQVTVSCTWDNPTSQPVTWGESTTDEMCLAFVYATL